ncbi:MAG: DUF4124 domain-containing protein [Candidatus Accumulibacter sp.]|nr:DUF4124 domain-containing protein [Accumulibacter sp.]
MTNSFCKVRAAVVLLLAAVSLARAEAMYQCVDESGHKTFSNVKPSDKSIKCTTLDFEPITSVPAPPKPSAGAASPAKFPRVGESAQKARDQDRRHILENELRAERQNLEQAKKELAEQESTRNGNEQNYQKVLDRLEPYKNKAALHERNIEAIENELAKLR